MADNSTFPKEGDIFIFTYAYHLKFFAIVIGETEKSIKFQEIGETILASTSNPLNKDIVSIPNPIEKKKKFTARKSSFGSDGSVICSYNNSYGSAWKGENVKSTIYY